MVHGKKANAWINVMVLLIVALCLVALFSFLKSSGKVGAEIAGVDALNEVYLDEGAFEFYVKFAGEEAVDKTYAELKGDEIPTIDNFFENFGGQFEKYREIDKIYLKKEKFAINHEKNVLMVGVDRWEANSQIDKDVKVLYRRNFVFEFLLK